MRINDLPFGYLVREGDGLQYEAGDLVLNGRRRIPLIASERRILHSMGLFKPDDELVVIYGGVRGEVKGHYSTLKPKDATKYCFSNVCIRDYVSC